MPSFAQPFRPSAQRGVSHQPLQGLRLGLVCGDEGTPSVLCFKQAARALGAEVTVLDPARVLDDGAALEDVMRLLGHLYGAVACDGLPPAVTRRLTMAALVPVLDVRAVLALGEGAQVDGDVERRNEKAQAALLAALR